MKTIELKKLILKNFKGIKDLTVNFGKETVIRGENATGKTTIFDAFTWLLFDKDSLNRSNFGIKTYDENNQVIHGLEHSVAAELEIDGKPLNLTKIYKEIWTNKRGSTEQTFSGHTTDYFINEVPIPKGEYTSRIGNIISDEEFKLLTNPHYFNEVLSKDERRGIILSLEDVTDQEVIGAMDPRPVELEEQLEDYNQDEIRAMTRASLRKINDEIKELPIRIDELRNQIKEVNVKALEEEREKTRAELDLVNGNLKDSKAILDSISSKVEEISKLKLRARELEEEVEENYKKELKKANESVEKHQEESQKLEDSIKTIKYEISLKSGRLSALEEDIKALLDQYYQEDEKELKGSKSCPSCGQALPSEELERIQADFNENKSKTLENIKKEGAEARSRQEQIKKELGDMKARLEQKEKALKLLENNKPEEVEVKKEKLPMEHGRLLAMIQEKEQELSWNAPDDKEAEGKKKELENKLDEIQGQLSQVDRNKELEARIRKLADSEKDLSRSYEIKEGLLYQLDEFIKTKVEMISGKVNAHFENVNFKLFEVQVNGGINPTCEVTVNGVPYSDLNNAAKINAGLDVINTLSDLYEVSAPVFIDNSESINEVLDVESQVVKLMVSKHKNLRVEVESE